MHWIKCYFLSCRLMSQEAMLLNETAFSVMSVIIMTRTNDTATYWQEDSY